jgi:hypothetical protein
MYPDSRLQPVHFAALTAREPAKALIFTYNLVADFVQCGYHRCKPTMEMHDDIEYRRMGSPAMGASRIG